jgi:hypothetical protein
MYGTKNKTFQQPESFERSVQPVSGCRKHCVEDSLARFGAKVDRCIGRVVELKVKVLERAYISLTGLNQRLKTRCQSLRSGRQRIKLAWSELRCGLRTAWQDVKSGWAKAVDRLH